MSPVYLDHNATTPLDPEVLEAMLPVLRDSHGNPSSLHRYGRLARSALDRAREEVAALVGAEPSQVVFTSGGTEANNLALQGVVGAATGGTLLIGATEHPSVREPALAMKSQGWQVDVLAVDALGAIDTAGLQAACQGPVRWISVMLANNETGVLQDLRPVADAAQRVGAVLHTDAVQAAGKVALDFAVSGAQLMSLSSHKLNGPKGVGALIVDKRVELTPLLRGGGQERGRRAGTENVAGIVGFGAAARLAHERLAAQASALRRLRDRLEKGLMALGGVEIFARDAERLPNTVSFAVRGVDGATLVLMLDRAGFAVSGGSACSSENVQPSPVLLAMGAGPDLARGLVRVSLGRGNTDQDVDAFMESLTRQLAALPRRAAG